MTENKLLQFPCHFPIKIIGLHTERFEAEVRGMIKKHFPHLENPTVLSQQNSKQGRYLALTATVYAESQQILDDFYKEVSKHPEVKMVL